jgi:hypothetical protein
MASWGVEIHEEKLNYEEEEEEDRGIYDNNNHNNRDNDSPGRGVDSGDQALGRFFRTIKKVPLATRITAETMAVLI